MKRSSSFFYISILILVVAVSGGIFFVWQTYGKKQQDLKELLIDDTLYAEEINAAAKKHGLPPELVRAVIKRESKFKKDKIGGAGEIGLMQVLPRGAAAEWARVNKCPAPTAEELRKIEVNLDIGCWYLARAMRRWQEYLHGKELALAEYNAGPKNALRWKPEDKNGEVINRIDYPTTRQYVTDIMHFYREYLLASKR